MVQYECVSTPIMVGMRVRAKRRIDWVPPSTYGTVRDVYDAIRVYQVRFDGHPAMCDVLDDDIEVARDEQIASLA
jgi:hypothetical protein